MRHCLHESCPRQANYNVEGSKAAYCKKHADDDMVDVVSRRCARAPCTRQPTFNTKGSKEVAYCKQHAKDGMVDVLRKTCSHHPCSRRPSCGVLADGVATVCIRHRGDPLRGPVINFNSDCKVKGCKRLTKWGLAGQQPTHCPKHGPLQKGLVCTVGTVRSKRTPRAPSPSGLRKCLNDEYVTPSPSGLRKCFNDEDATPSHSGLRKCLNDEDVGTPSKRARRAMPWAVTPFAADEQYIL